ncbi:MAG: hypothetical protein HQ582_03045 [Planctomycetes bacterium]|nr:hypothetical protein [Planctomycetota bacterium]
MPENEKISLVMKWALLEAARADEWADRKLGPIHLIKYVYLADMDYAKFNGGETFTGAEWVFHKFGPWSVAVNDEIDASLPPWGAKREPFPSKFSDEDCIRWSVDPGDILVAESKKQLPLEVRHIVSSYIDRFHNDTSGLLHFIYATPPLLNAAPGELLDFSVMPGETPEPKTSFVPLVDRLSRKKRKRLAEGMEELRKRFKAGTAPAQTSRTRRLDRETDGIFEEGVTWLESLAGANLPDRPVRASFSDEVWKSAARNGDV